VGSVPRLDRSDLKSFQHIFISYVQEPRNVDAEFDVAHAATAHQIVEWMGERGKTWRVLKAAADRRAFLESIGPVGRLLATEKGEGATGQSPIKDGGAGASRAKESTGDGDVESEDEDSDGVKEVAPPKEAGDAKAAGAQDEGTGEIVEKQVWDAKDHRRRITAQVQLRPPVPRMQAKSPLPVSVVFFLIFDFLILLIVGP
jgi:hypothetical protein